MKQHWLGRERILLYSRTVVVGVLAAFSALLWLSPALVDAKGRPLGTDFITFWGASRLALDGNAAAAYQLEAIYRAEQAGVPALRVMFAWFYPPTYFLLVLPLALMPYLLAFSVFIAATLAAFVAVFRRIASGNVAMWCLAGFSGTWLNIMQGQNAFLTAALAACCLVSLKQRPVLAGICLGALAIKPHLALLFPLALLAAGAWRALAVAAITALAFTGLSVSVLGAPTLAAFLDSLDLARHMLEDGKLPWHKMPSVFAAVRLLGMPLLPAYCAQAACSCAAAWLTWRAWRGNAPPALRNALLMTASLLASPYVYDYDMAWLAFPGAWLALDALRHGWRRGERELLVVLWILPAALAPLAKLYLPLAPLLLAALVCLLWRRIRSSHDGETPHAQPAPLA
jgi:hypothetical protein